jgi:NADH-quinone oxidoreductase E subunit
MSSASHQAVVQPASFAFTPETAEKAKAVIAKYPAGRQRSAVMPLLDLAQRQEGWVSQAAMDHIAGMLGMPPIRVYEVATFYTMFNLAPVGKHHVQICTNICCLLRGSDEVVKAAGEELGIHFGETTADGQFTLAEVECLGACVNAPMMQINDDYYEDLDAASTKRILAELKAGRQPKPGPQIDRINSAPVGGPTTLRDIPAE